MMIIKFSFIPLYKIIITYPFLQKKATESRNNLRDSVCYWQIENFTSSFLHRHIVSRSLRTALYGFRLVLPRLLNC